MTTLYRYAVSDPVLNQITKRPNQYRKLMFGLNFYHSIVMSRRKYDPNGYTFSLQDHSMALERYRVSNSIILIIRVKQYLNRSDELNEEIPYKALQYLISEIIYGSQIPDHRDVMKLRYLIGDFMTPSILDDKYPFTSREVLIT